MHASGRISTIFGEAFAPQDEHAVQVRMPEPPLLLADRVTGLTGAPITMGKGSVWTETDVRADAFYLDPSGRMPAGLMIESGQADLFLISWLGADLENRGARAYRLLGCELTWHRAPPRPGETLAYDIHVDGHAKQGEQRLFFFHYDCHIDGAPALTVRSGQAGFFTTAELAASAGVIWSPEAQAIDAEARLDPARVACTRRSFDDEALRALAEGDVAACFGPGFEASRTHLASPRIAGGEMRFYDRVTDFDPTGGPWGRGYLRAVQPISPDDWFFRGHFKNDPCMPGTLMLEGCFSAMAFYLIGLGSTLDRDGWRFEPIPHETYTMICRGQVIPSSRELTYELFVEEVHDGDEPRLYADLLCTVDGMKAFHARRLGLRLVPDAPLDALAIQRPTVPELARLGDREPEPVASLDGAPLDLRAILASAWGAPSAAFGPRYAIFDGARRAPRLPGPPYLMAHRVTALEGAPWTKKAGASIEVAYDVPASEWYFGDGGTEAMPYALLLEAALQPCGLLATISGATLDRPIDLRFRNLDGEGEVLAPIPPGAGTLRTRATLTTLSDTTAMVIVGFDVTVALEGADVYRLKTVFGFFPDAAFEGGAGLAVSAADRALRDASGDPIALDARPDLFEGSARLADRRLRLLDTIPFFDPSGGPDGLGAARGERRIDPRDWFFAAHFFQDPVQPGSLGMEAMLQLLRFVMLERGLHRGMRAPRFEPIATGTTHRWTYRGQVRPTDGRVAVTLAIIALEDDARGRLAQARCSFWVDDKRIYEATIAARLIESADATPAYGVAIEPLRARWREHLGVEGPWLGEDLSIALLDRFVGRVIDDGEAVSGPALYVANHQSAIETLMLSLILGARGRPLVTVAKREHREGWYGELLAWLFRHPSVRLAELTAYFDRADPSALPGLLRGLPHELGVLVHVEGTRATRARAPLGPFSGVPIDVAIERGLPIVPVRVSGGLPLHGAQKLDFPFEYAPQDVRIGEAIDPETLAPLDYGARVARVRAAIEALAPAQELPRRGDPDFARAVHARRIDEPHAVLLECLARARPRSALGQRLARAARGVAPLVLDPIDPEDRWLAALAARLGLA